MYDFLPGIMLKSMHTHFEGPEEGAYLLDPGTGVTEVSSHVGAGNLSSTLEL